ncbi:hypothetical protein A4X13_0g2303 [Tilletia indica]|uniref:Uncharacterized protein n=1 Tax=Tilletia indica TaxID=43049 RepID=A0A177TJY3_9BASI|nr:hypothetical protein A4X13_0g2303 [Tilletia indica]
MNSSDAAARAPYPIGGASSHQQNNGYQTGSQQSGSGRWPTHMDGQQQQHQQQQQQQQQQRHQQQQQQQYQHQHQHQQHQHQDAQHQANMHGQQPFIQQSVPMDSSAPLQAGLPAGFPQPNAPWLPLQQQHILPMPFMASSSAPLGAAQPMPTANDTHMQAFHGALSQSGTHGQFHGGHSSASASFDSQDQFDDSEAGEIGEQRESASGPIRSKPSTTDNREKAGKGPIAAPVKAACTFCRSRKSRCDGKHPCATCIAREKVDDCVFTVSRRGGKPKAKKPANPEVLENHLRHLAMLSELPHTARIPDNATHITNIQDFSTIFPTGRPEHVLTRSQNGSSISSAASESAHASHASTDNSLDMFGPIATFPGGPSGNPISPTWTPMSGASAVLSGAELASLYDMTSGPSGSDAAVLLPGSSGPILGADMVAQLQQIPAQPSNATQPQWSDRGTNPFPSDTKILLEDYYKYLHRFIPVLPSPVYIDALTSSWDPQSPFLLALQALLPLVRDEIQPVDALHGRGGFNFGNAAKKEQVRKVTSHYEKLANEAVERAVDSADGDAKGKVALEVIQALCVLTIFDYGSGRAVKARLKADQALGLAMAEGLHRLRSSSATQGNATSVDFFGTTRLPESEVFEMKKRCWWTVWSLILWAAYNTGNTSTLRADDPRVTCEMPYSSDPTAWIANMRSLQCLLTVQERVIALTNLNALETENKEAASPYAVASPMSGRTVTTPISLHSFGQGSPMAGQGGPSSTVPPVNSSRNALFSSMLELDRQLEEQIEMQEAQLAAVRNGRNVETFAGLPSSLESAEDAMIAYLHTSATIQLYTSSLTLHIGQAFRGASLFERKLCFLNPNKGQSGSDSAQACSQPIPTTFLNEFAQQAGGRGAPPTFPASNAPNNAVIGDIFNPFSWMTQNFAMADPSQNLSIGGPSAQPSSSQLQPEAPNASKASSESGSGVRKVRKDSFAQGPFPAQHSLGRCVRASIRLLEIASNKRLEPNPFNACSFVLISYVLLMLAISRGMSSDDDEDEDDDYFNDENGVPSTRHHDDGTLSNKEQLLQLAGLSTDGTLSSPSLQQIWNRVQQARDSLAALSEIWDMVIPMVWEITSCLETSRTLFSQEQG